MLILFWGFLNADMVIYRKTLFQLLRPLDYSQGPAMIPETPALDSRVAGLGRILGPWEAYICRVPCYGGSGSPKSLERVLHMGSVL